MQHSTVNHGSLQLLSHMTPYQQLYTVYCSQTRD